MDSVAPFTMATGGQRIMRYGYWPISRQHGDVVPSSSHGKSAMKFIYCSGVLIFRVVSA